jgi:membrane-associated phospholipid phosphatase
MGFQGAAGHADSPGADGRATLTSNVSKPWRRGLLWLALLAPFFYASYGLANHLAAARAHVTAIVFGWEKHVPFWDWTIFPYWSINVFYGLSLLLARTRHELDRHAARLLTAQVLAVLCFIAWPLQFSFGQPAVDGAAGWLFAALRGFDKPFNQAPSLHIALALILWDLYRRLLTGRAARFVLHAWTFAICASVLTTWQHHVIDIPTGALLGAVCVWAWPLERRVSMRQACALTADARRRALAARYAGGALVLAGLSLTLGGMGLWLLWGSVSLAMVAANYLLFGARGFRMDATGRMAWEARLLLAPYRLGAAINARLWTRGQPPLREVVDGVSLGGLARLPRHARAGRARARPRPLPALARPGAGQPGRAAPCRWRHRTRGGRRPAGGGELRAGPDPQHRGAGLLAGAQRPRAGCRRGRAVAAPRAAEAGAGR